LIKDFNVIIAGKDPVAVDTVGSTIMGFDAKHDIPMLRGAEMAGLGVATLDQIEVIGTAIEKVRRPFKRGDIHLIGLHPKIEVYMGGACDGCLHFTRTGLDVYLANPTLMEEVEKITFIIGNDVEIPDHLDHRPPRSYDFVVGDCTDKHKDRGIFLPGCASTSMHRTFFPGKSSEEVLENYRRFNPRSLTSRDMSFRSRFG
jgi:Fe-S cluster biogenesis protein NfuA